MTETIGCAIAVHRALGPGFLESIYKKAMHLELNARGISYESEKAITVSYRGTQIEGQRVDLIVEGSIVVELKAVARGLLINFRIPVLKAGLKRIVL
jgi:GxxExxY protein